jgi:DNA-binding transcriptional MerR regulator
MKSSRSAIQAPASSALVLVARTEVVTHTLEAAAELAGIHPAMLRHYCRLGLFGAVRARPESRVTFDDDALYELRRFEHFRQRQGVDRQTLRLIHSLWCEIERLQDELRFLRER